MSRLTASIGLVATMALSGCGGVATGVRIHSEPAAKHHVLSYDGSKMIVQRDHRRGRYFDVIETASNQSFGLSSRSFKRAVWGENSDVAYAIDKDKKIYRLSFVADAAHVDRIALRGPEAIPADEAPKVVLFPSPMNPYLVAASSRGRKPLYRCELRPGSGEGNIETRCAVVVEDGRGVIHWLMTPEGRAAARVRISRSGQRVFQTLTSSGKWDSPFYYTKYYTELTPIGFVQQDGTVWALSNRQRETIALVRLNIETGEEEVFFQHDRFDLEKAAIAFDKFGKGTPLLVTCNPDHQVVVHFHDRLAAAYEAVYENLGKPSRINFKSIDGMEKYAIVEVRNPQLYRSWYLLDLQNNTSRELSGGALASHGRPPPPSRPVTFPARDGLKLYGYLTLPQGVAAGRPPPMILMLHGGPWSRYLWPARSLVRFFAGKGYAALRLNYRGSRGYDRRFLEAGKGALFGRLQHDVLDAAEWAVANGYAAREGIALFGGSFGGFLTLVMLARHPDVFKAGIALNAITDAVQFWKTDWLRAHTRALWREFFRSSDLPEAALSEISPVNNLDRFSAPVLLIAGTQDRRVPVSHSQELFHLLKQGGKAVKLIEYQHAAHNIWRTNTDSREHIVASIEAFLVTNLGRKVATR